MSNANVIEPLLSARLELIAFKERTVKQVDDLVSLIDKVIDLYEKMQGRKKEADHDELERDYDPDRSNREHIDADNRQRAADIRSTIEGWR